MLRRWSGFLHAALAPVRLARSRVCVAPPKRRCIARGLTGWMMSEEFFLSKQLMDVGEQVYYEPKIRVIHHWHGSLEKIPGRKRWDMARDAHREYRKYVKVFRRG